MEIKGSKVNFFPSFTETNTHKHLAARDKREFVMFKWICVAFGCRWPTQELFF